jgi:predicted type IV restriction endonuclease
MNMDNAFERFAKFKGEVEPSLGGILSEADARLKLINRMLTEVLGWQFDEIQPEQHSPEGFADYLLSRGGTRRLVIEAKKTGVVLTTSVNPKMAAHKVSGPALRQAADIFRQAAGYCMDQGVEFAVITSGDRWIFFNPFPKNGTPYHDSKAILFPSLAAIEESFATFYELAAPGSVVNRLYRTVFGKVEGLSLQHIWNLSLSSSSPT